MLIAIIGENCAGKTTLAKQLNEKVNARIYSGKDYLRLEKNPSAAELKFKELLKEALNGENVIYIISEKDQMALLPKEAFKIVVTEELSIIKERFSKRMHGNLPKPVEMMLEKKHGMFDDVECDMKIYSNNYTIDDIVRKLNSEEAK